MKKFCVLTREEHYPNIDQTKSQQLENLRNKLQHNPNFKDYIEVSRHVMMKGVFFDKNGNIKKNDANDKHYDELLEYQSEHEEGQSKGNKYL